MGSYFSLKQNKTALKDVLDLNFPPVARFRMLSQGISTAHRMENGQDITGNQGCIACGNCVDRCPQVRRLKGQLTSSNNRTSMHLENVVDDSCLRCYDCINSCPQVDRQLKNYAVRFRMTEKMVHWFLVAVYVIAATSGIGLNHFHLNWDPTFIFIIGLIHRTASVGVLLTPILLYIYDREHMARILKRSFTWSGADWEWIKNAVRYATGDKNVSLYQGEYNPGQKVWYILLTGSFLVLGASGIVQWVGTPYFSAAMVETWRIVHVFYAMAVDTCVAIHILRRILRLVIRLRELFNKDLSLSFTK